MAIDPLRSERSLEAFRRRYAEDRDAGTPRTLLDYLAAFPGEEETVGREYARLRGGDESPSSAPGGPDSVGPYRLVRELGRGGQAVVHLAEDTRLHRFVALKVLTGLGPGSEDALRRFRREAEVASKLNHPGICAVHDAGIAGGVPYIAMQYVEGSTLAQRLSATRHEKRPADSFSLLVFSETTAASPMEDGSPGAGPAAPAPAATRREIGAVLGIFEKCARALHDAHEAGIVHRDIKPGNIMVTAKGEPVILDFGLARADDGDGEALTRTGDVFGTPAYMSPEQISGQGSRLDRRSDVWSLGASLYECLTLRRPFEAPTRAALHQAILTRSPPDPRAANRAIPRDLKVVLETALEKERDRRYATAAALAGDLRAVIDGRPIQARPAGAAGKLARWAKREPAKAGLLLVLLTALPAIAALVTSRMKDLPRIEAARLAEIEREKDEVLSAAGFEVIEGDPEKAAALYSRALAMAGDRSEAAGGLVLARLARKDAAGARWILDRHREALGGGAAAILLRAAVEEKLGARDAAAALRASAPPPATAFEHALLATKEMADGEAGDEAAFRRALGHARLAISLSPAPRLRHYTLLAHAAGHAGDRDAAVGAAAGLRSHWPGSADAHDWRGFALAGANDPALLPESVAACREATRIDPGRATAHGNLGMALGMMGSPDVAEAAFRESIRLEPGDARAHFDLGTALTNQGRFDEGIVSLREAVRLDPGYAEAACNLGVALSKRGDAGEAAGVLRAAIRLKPGDGHAHSLLGGALLSQGLLKEALEAQREAVRLAPDRAEFRYNLAIALADTGRLDESVAAYRETIRLRPDDAEAHCNLAFVLRESRQVREALEVLRRGDELGRKRPAWDYPSGSWVEEFTRQAAGEERLEGLLEEHLESGAEPESASRRVELARLLLGRDRPALAARWCESAFAEAPELADIFEAGHRRLAARAAARASVAVRAASPELAGDAAARLRLQALSWLEEELAAASRAWTDRALSPRQLRVAFLPLSTSPDFAPFRDSSELAALPDSEQVRWSGLWSGMTALLASLDDLPAAR